MLSSSSKYGSVYVRLFGPLSLLLLLCHLTSTTHALPELLAPVSDLWREPSRVLQFMAACQGRADWEETREGHVINLDVPGMSIEELKIELDENRVLRVGGERKRVLDQKKKKKGNHRWHKTERWYGKFQKEFNIPENADLNTVEARLENGVLTLGISKLSPDRIVRPRTVNINTKKAKQEL